MNTPSSINWTGRFPLWDWVDGRISEFSAAKLLPACLQGIGIDGLLATGQIVDSAARRKIVKDSPTAQLYLDLFIYINDKVINNIAFLPCKTLLDLFLNCLPKLVMESLGKALDLVEKLVNQIICLLGNKFSTCQNFNIQQFRHGLNNFFATFIKVHKNQFGSHFL